MFDKLPVKTIDGKRYYVAPNGVAYPSMTTVTGTLPSPELESWKKAMIEKYGEGVPEYIKVMAGIRGNTFHNLIEEYLPMNQKYDWSQVQFTLKKKYPKLLSWALFENLIPELDKIKDIQCQEATLYSDWLRVAGRVDCIAKFDSPDMGFSDNAVIDFKTATKPKRESDIQNYFMQASGYSQCYLERTGIDIPNIVILISCESGERQVYIRKRDDYIDQLKQLADKYHEEHPIE